MISPLASQTLQRRATHRSYNEDESAPGTDAADSKALRVIAASSSVEPELQIRVGVDIGSLLSQPPPDVVESVIESAVSDVVAAVEAVTDKLVTAHDIESIFHHASYSTGYVGLTVAVSLVEKTTLLLKNGLAYVGLDVSPLSLSVPAQVTQDSGKWTSWRHGSSGAYELQNTFSGNWASVQGERVDTDPAECSALAGSYVRTQSESIGSTIFSRQKGLTLDAVGRFIISDSSLVTSGGLGSITSQTPLNLHTYQDADSSSQLFSSGFQPELNGENSNIHQSREMLVNNRERYGTYRLLEDGATLELTNALGEVSNRLFVRLQGRVAMQGVSYVHYRPTAGYFDIERLLEESGPVQSEDGNWKDIVAKANNKPRAEAGSGTGSDGRAGDMSRTNGDKSAV